MSELLDRIDLRYDLVARKISEVEITENGCWNWTGKLKTSRGNYGQITLYSGMENPKKRTYSAHRVSYAFHHGIDPAEMCVMHTCDNPRCINPDHLELGTHTDNMRDMVEKGRSTIGETNPNSKLSESTVLKIVAEIKRGKNNTEIAAEHPVTHSQVSLIRLGKSWRHVTSKLDYEPEKYRKRKAA